MIGSSILVCRSSCDRSPINVVMAIVISATGAPVPGALGMLSAKSRPMRRLMMTCERRLVARGVSRILLMILATAGATAFLGDPSRDRECQSRSAPRASPCIASLAMKTQR